MHKYSASHFNFNFPLDISEYLFGQNIEYLWHRLTKFDNYFKDWLQMEMQWHDCYLYNILLMMYLLVWISISVIRFWYMKKIFHHEVPPIMFQHKLVISIQISFSKTEDLVMHVQNSFAKCSRWYIILFWRENKCRSCMKKSVYDITDTNKYGPTTAI